MREYSPDGLMSPGPAQAVPGADGAQMGQVLDTAAADLALRATRYLRARFRDHVTVGDLATRLAYSPSHLTRVFTAAVGTSPMDYLAAWRLHEAKHLLVAHRLGVAETCHEVGYTSVGTFSRRFLRDVGTPPGALRRIADRIAERTLPAVSLLVPAARRIRVRPQVPEEMRRALGPAPYQWVGTFPRPVPSGLPATGTLRRGIDEVELPVVPGAPLDPRHHPSRRRQRPRAPGPHEPARRTTACPRGSSRRPRHPSGACRPALGPHGPRCPGGDGGLKIVRGGLEKCTAQESRIGVVRGVPAGLASWSVTTSLDRHT